MTPTPNLWQAGAIVPLADRVRYMRWVRGTLVVSVLAFAILPATRTAGLPSLIAVSGGFVLVSVGGELVWRRRGGRGLYLFSAMLISDGAYLAWATYATGAGGSMVRYLVVLHVIAVSLLASYRTGLKLAFWHSILALAIYYAQEAETVSAGPDATSYAASDFQWAVAFIGVLWLVAITTAGCSAGNERELRRRRVDLEALATMATRLERTIDHRAVGETLVDSVSDTFGFARCALLVGTHAYRLLAARGIATPLGTIISTASGSALRRAESDRRTLLVSRLAAEADPGLQVLLGHAQNVIVVPLVAEDRSIGVLIAEHGLHRGSRVEHRVVATTERFVSHAALALHNAWLLEEVQSLAAHDALTGVANRRTFEQTLQREISRAARHGCAVGLVLLDLDHFKWINDRHGHQVGDAVLQDVAGVLQRISQDTDLVARYGGEEFVVVLPDRDQQAAADTAERIRAAVASADVGVPVTASVGVACFPDQGADVEALVRAADAALYVAKQRGRDRVAVAPVPARA